MSENSSAHDGLREKCRRIRHDVNNSLAVLMALAELAERNTDQVQKLISAVKTRCPEIVTHFKELQKALEEADRL